MALLPTTNFVTSATGNMMAQYNYFARPITIYKAPVQTIVNAPDNLLFGYTLESQTNNSQTNLSFETINISGLIIYPLKVKNQNSSLFDNKLIINPNATYIKLRESDALTYILDGRKNEKLVFDNQTWNFTEGNKFQNAHYLGLSFFYFEVKGTN